MRIPLDYYRILGLPIQATADQLQQAHRDRTLQLPRREFSEAAITARKQLIDEAYAVLSDTDERKAYDATFLAKSYDLEPSVGDAANVVALPGNGAIASDLDPYTPSIEIKENQLVGALLILLELGEYELVLKLGRPYLGSGSLTLNSGRYGQPDIVRADIVLTIAFACLELGREQWQQGQYENAAESLETGQELLLREGLFPSVRGEMQSDLFKLRPYRILELLALPKSNEASRHQGLTLLRDMLQDRGGIDGTNDDQSGLSVDDFLRFIQQLRGYLTSAEQQALFEAEARRPSAVATYLAVYALLARGFSQRQPALIRRAKLMLIRLGTRQDVHLEQSVCALLLGQTEEASRALELSQEYESLAFIREHSQGSPDLLPGLCLYAERWLHNEVFPHFRDLADQSASLKEYFADEQVQAYLEELPNEPEPVNQWVPQASAIAFGQSSNQYGARNGTAQSYGQSAGPRVSRSATATMESTATYPAPGTTNGSATMPSAERVSQLSPEGRLSAARSTPSSDRAGSSDRRTAPANTMRVPPVTPLPRRSSSRRAPRLDRLLFLLALGVLGIGVLWIVLSWLAQAFSGPALRGDQLALPVNEPVVPIPSPSPVAATPAPNAPLTNETAQTTIESWLSAKAKAMGSEYDTSTLSSILVEPLLSQRQGDAQTVQNAGVYCEYRHQLQVASVNTSATNPNQAQADARVIEASTCYGVGGELQSSSSDDLQLRYDLVRQNGQWRIQGIERLATTSPTEAALPEVDSDASPDETLPTTPVPGNTSEPPATVDSIVPQPSGQPSPMSP